MEFFGPWPLREIRIHFEDLVERSLNEKKDATMRAIRQRRSSKSASGEILIDDDVQTSA